MTDPMNPLEELSLDELRARASMKWRSHPADVLPLWVAEMDVRLAPPIVETLKHVIDRGDTGYPSHCTSTRYGEALSAFAAERWSWHGLDVDRTAIVPDVMLGVVEALRLVTNPGDTVIVSPPVYAPFYAFITHDGRRVAEAPLGVSGRLDLDNLEAAFRQARAAGGHPAYLLSSPHNPTGTVHTAAELRAVAELARRYGVRVVSDEVHAPLVLPGAAFTPYLSVPGSEDAFVLMSASKGWNLAGLKAALLIAGTAAESDLRRLPEEVSHGPSQLGIIAHTAAFQEGRAWLDALLAGLDNNRRLLADLLSEHLPAVGYLRPEGTYLAWLDCRPLGIDEPASDAEGDRDRLPVVSELSGPARMFLDRARVALSSGHVFGTGGAGHVRLNFATSAAVLTAAVSRMGEALHASDRRN